jgi:hypothetical protein
MHAVFMIAYPPSDILAHHGENCATGQALLSIELQAAGLALEARERKCVMSDYVWLSMALDDVTLIGKFHTDIVAQDVDIAIKAGTQIQRGQPVPKAMCPKKIWCDKNSSVSKRIPRLIDAEGYWIVTAHAADILKQFDLGGGALYPVSEGIFQKDQVTRVPGDYFCWIFGNVKNAFLEQHSPRAKPMSGADTRDWCKMPFDLADDDIAVSSAAQIGPDVWVDPILFQSLFVSARLGDALEAAGLRKAFRLFRCPVL